MSTHWADRHFRWLLFGLCAFFVGVECYYATHTNIHYDEFQYAWMADRAMSEVPFREFRPGKTLLGYYVIGLGKGLSDDAWGALVSARLLIVAINVVMLAIVAGGLRRVYSATSVLLGVALLVTMSTFLERCHDIRMDVMSAWLTVGALVLLLNRRAVLAGVVATLGVLTSQKAVYGGFAGGAALCVAWLLLADQRRPLTRMILAYGFTCIAIGAAYLGIASALGGAASALDATITGHTQIAFANLYPEIDRYWHQTAARNPLFWMLAVVALLRLGFDQCRRDDPTRREYRYVVALGFLLFYLPLALWHRQPWPYFIAMVAPMLLMPMVAWFERERESIAGWMPLHRGIATAIFVMLGIVVPGTRLVQNLGDHNSYQAETVRIAAQLLEPGETYLAGMNIISGHEQASADLSWLDNHHLARIAALPDDQKQRIVDEVRASPMRLYLKTSKVGYHMPPWPYMLEHYEHVTHVVYAWSPSVPPGEHAIETKFAGRYEVVADKGARVSIDGRAVEPGATIELTGADHVVMTDTPIRLRWQVDIPDELLPHGRQPARDFFYRYQR